MEIVTVDAGLVERFAALFRGNGRSFGQYNNKDKKAVTLHKTYELEHIAAHLDGVQGLGVVPILDDGTCLWAAIDIDVHGPAGSPHVDIFAIEEKIRRMELPLVVCRSKSGGAHAYVFFKIPQTCADVRLMLTRWEVLLGYPGAEIFPKQSHLDRTKEELGNWINLPYFDVSETNRYCVDGGKEVGLDYFLSLAEGRRCTLETYEKQAGSDYEGGPPCLQRMLETRIEEGGRNTAVFQAGIFLKRAYPEDWRPRLELFNRLALLSPLAVREVRTIAGSVGRKDYQYKCREEPCRTLCDRPTCKTRSFGINDLDERANEVPPIDKVEQIIATPIKWALTIRGKLIELTTPQLFNYDIFRQAVFDQLHLLMPAMRRQEWDVYLRELVGNVEVVQETTIEDVMMQRVTEYCRRTRADKNEPEEVRRDALRRGMPGLISIVKLGTEDREWFYAFKLLDFVEYLKRRKALTVPEHQVSLLLMRTIGVQNKRAKLRIGNITLSNVWCLPESMVEEEKVPELKSRPEY